MKEKYGARDLQKARHVVMAYVKYSKQAFEEGRYLESLASLGPPKHERIHRVTRGDVAAHPSDK